MTTAAKRPRGRFWQPDLDAALAAIWRHNGDRTATRKELGIRPEVLRRRLQELDRRGCDLPIELGARAEPFLPSPQEIAAEAAKLRIAALERKRASVGEARCDGDVGRTGRHLYPDLRVVSRGRA